MFNKAPRCAGYFISAARCIERFRSDRRCFGVLVVASAGAGGRGEGTKVDPFIFPGRRAHKIVPKHRPSETGFVCVCASVVES